MPKKDNAASRSHSGNKSYLPSKHCTVCGRPMTWRRKWARSWDDVKYCSEQCRKKVK